MNGVHQPIVELDDAVSDNWRRTLLLAIPFGALAFVVGAVLDGPSGQSIPVDAIGYPVMAVALMGVELLLLLRRDSLRIAITTIVLGASSFFALKLLALLFGGLDAVMVQRQMTETFFWIPVIYLLSFLVPGLKTGRIVSSVFTGAVLLISLTGVIVRAGMPGGTGLTYALIEMNLANSVQLALTYAFIGLKEAYQRNHIEREAAERFAFTDQLTGLPNRRVLERAFEKLDLSKGTPVAAMFIDVDGFKVINDTLGHEAGDQLLKRLGGRLSAAMRDEDLVVRLSGDEFMVLAQGVDSQAEASSIAQRIFSVLAAPVVINESDISISASIGVAFYPRDAHDAATLVRHADSAMYMVKRSGKNGLRFYTPDTASHLERRGDIEHELGSALAHKQFSLEYQPIVDVNSGDVVKMEALLRWSHPRLGQVGPAEFVPIAEESGAIVAIGTWVLGEACRQLRAWHDSGLQNLRLAINVSPLQFSQPTFFRTVVGAIEAAGVPAASLELELTESVVVNRVDDVRGTLAALRALGISIAIDDFGTGYSSLAYLRDLPIDAVKIDRGFVRDLARPREAPQFALALVEAILTLAQHLDLTIVAEGVETEDQRTLLAGLGCHEAQGFYFSRPMPASEVPAYLRRAPHDPVETVVGRLVN